MQHEIRMIAAIGKHTHAIGKDNDLIFDIPEDLKRFRVLTNGHPIIMGRKTWESLPPERRPLPNRTNIIVTTQTGYEAPGALVCTSISEAITLAKQPHIPGNEKIYIIGGGQIYMLGLHHADYLDLTEIDDASLDANDPKLVRFPNFEGFKELGRETHPLSTPNFDYVTYQKAA